MAMVFTGTRHFKHWLKTRVLFPNYLNILRVQIWSAK
jgi:hypothetical protein